VTEFLKASKFRYLSLGFAYGSGVGQGLCDGLAIDLVSKPKIRPMSWLIGLMAATILLAATTIGGTNGTWTKVTQSTNPLHNRGTPLF